MHHVKPGQVWIFPRGAFRVVQVFQLEALVQPIDGGALRAISLRRFEPCR